MEKFKEQFNDVIRAALVIGWSLYTMIFLIIIVLFNIPKENILNAGTAMGFIFGVVTGGTGVYFSLDTSKKETNSTTKE